ncbi:MAG: aspartate kinase [Acidimicrobiales bacterium]|nr:aspartate kinase [Acidimicrobiales bacterium]
MALLVQKFGGTSVADPDRMRAVADHVARTLKRGHQVVVVISAMGKETDDLLRLAQEVSSTRPGREMDMLITAGERKATALLCMALHDLGVEAESFTGSQAGFITDSTHMNARIIEVRPDRVRKALDEGKVPVVGGAQGVSIDKNVTFLGRGGSDTTAVALAHALGAEVCELYTDVSGVFTSDPRVVDNARKMDRISFDELLEMTANGCPKPAMRSVEYARTHGVNLHVRSAFTWEPGTLVTKTAASPDGSDDMEQAIISAVVYDLDEAKITIAGVEDRPGIAGRLFRALADRNINVDMIVQNTSEQGHTDISFTVPRSEVERAVETSRALQTELGARAVTYDDHIGRVSVIGAGMKTHPGVAATVFETLAANDINIEMISTSAIRISCVVDEDTVERAVQVLHDAFELDKGPALAD